MGKHILVLGVAFLVLAAFAVGAGWLLFSASEPTPGGWSLGPLWPYLLGGAALMAGLVVFLVWLTLFSFRHPDDRQL